MNLVIALLILGASLLFISWTPPDNVVEAQQLVIRDKKGRIIGSFGASEDGLPALLLYSREAMVRVCLTTAENGAVNLTLFDQHGEKGLVLGLTDRDERFVHLYGKAKQPLLRLTLDKEDHPNVVIEKTTGDVLWQVPK